MKNIKDVIIVGAGPAGLGVGVLLRGIGVSRMSILERRRVGESFERWPRDMRFISPSFTSNGFAQMDLNSIAPATSPAYSLRTEHPTGKEYARYLRGVAKAFALPIERPITVKSVIRTPEGFELETTKGKRWCRILVWATGEFQYPRDRCFIGSDLCIHNSRVRKWSDLPGRETCVIGGFESGADAAVNLVRAGKKVTVLDRGHGWKTGTSDPSCALSPYTVERLSAASRTGHLRFVPNSDVKLVARKGERFTVETTNGKRYAFDGPPVMATGFRGGAGLIKDHFDWTDEGFPKLTRNDESTLTPGLFLAGPQVRHDSLIFCFVYKFRLRFGVIAREIGARLDLDTRPLESLRRDGLLEDDLSCCGGECKC